MLNIKKRLFITISYKMKQIKALETRAKYLRFEIIKQNYLSKTAHLASCLSCIDIMTVIFYRFKKKKDDFILSKGHAALSLYVILKDKKLISKKALSNYSKAGSILEEHPNPSIPSVACATGSLGHGLSFASGLAFANKIKKREGIIYVILGDGECNEGTIWEAALFASSNKLSNIMAIVDYNKWQGTGRTNDILNLEPLLDKWKSFGWDTYEINGNSIKEILNKFKKIIKNKKSQKPKVIIANTIKGKGVSFMEDDNNWHYRSPEYNEIITSKKEIFKK